MAVPLWGMDSIDVMEQCNVSAIMMLFFAKVAIYSLSGPLSTLLIRLVVVISGLRFVNLITPIPYVRR